MSGDAALGPSTSGRFRIPALLVNPFLTVLRDRHRARSLAWQASPPRPGLSRGEVSVLQTARLDLEVRRIVIIHRISVGNTERPELRLPSLDLSLFRSPRRLSFPPLNMPKFNFPLSLKPDESSDSLTRLPLHSPRLTASDATDPFPNDQYATYTPNRYSGSSAYSWTPSTPSTGKSEDALLRQGYSMSDSAGLAHFTAGVAPWSQSRLPVLGLLVALALQSILLAGSILVYVHPIERPTGVNIFSLPAKSYNVRVVEQSGGSNADMLPVSRYS